MATVRLTRNTHQIRFTNDTRFLGIPAHLVERAYGRRLEDDERVYFLLRLMKNNGLVLGIRPITSPHKAKTKPFTGWRCNPWAKRFYISAVGLKKALRALKRTLTVRGFPATVADGEIRAILPASGKQ